jgi:5,10-methylenetetrahydrofolate reductase
MDTDANDLLATAKLIDENDKLGTPDEWLIAASAAVHRPADGARPDKLMAKADAGAQLVIAQICHDPDVLQSYVDFLIEHQLLRRLSLMVSVAVVTSAEAAAWLAQNRRGTVMSEAFMESLVRSGDAEDAAVGKLGSLVARYAGMPGISGINFAAVTDLSLVPRILEQAGVRR